MAYLVEYVIAVLIAVSPRDLHSRHCRKIANVSTRGEIL